MTEQELREKIVEVLEEYRDWFIEEDYKRDITKIDYTGIADALIEAGIGDVKEAEQRAEAAEKTLRVLARKFVIFVFPNGDWKELIEQLVSETKEQAEKELAEEADDE